MRRLRRERPSKTQEEGEFAASAEARGGARRQLPIVIDSASLTAIGQAAGNRVPCWPVTVAPHSPALGGTASVSVLLPVASSTALNSTGLGVAMTPLQPGMISETGTAVVPMPTDPAGTATLNLQMPVNQALCGATVTGQYAEFQVGVCELVLTDGIAITIGN